MNSRDAALLVMLAAGGCGETGHGFPYADVTVGGHALRVEVASTPQLRFRGFRFRGSIPDGTGMLFIFPESEYHAFVMTDTTAPLSIAFADGDGTIFQIADMQPLSDARTWSTDRALYALEVPQGWFEARGISVGDRIEGVAAVASRHPPT